jgi:hypothetical protein
MVGVAMKDRVHGIPGQRLLQPARAEVRVDLERLTLDRPLDGRVVHQHHPPLRPDPRQRGFEFECLVQRLPHERLDRRLAPRTEGAPPEPPAEPFSAAESDPLDLTGGPIQDLHARVAQNARDLRRLVRLVVVVAEDRDDRDFEARKLPGQVARFGRLAVVGQIAAERQHVGIGGDPLEQRLEHARRRTAEVEVADGGDSETSTFG